MRQVVWFTEVNLRVTLPVGRGHRYVPQLTVGQTPGSDTATEQSVLSTSVWLHKLPSRHGSRWPVDKCLELRLRSPGGVSVQLPGVKPQRRAGQFLHPGAEQHAHRRWRGIVHPVQLHLRTGSLQLQEETKWIHQTFRFRWDFHTGYHGTM